MSKFITKEELLEAKCEAYKAELKKTEELLRETQPYVVSDISNENIILSMIAKGLYDKINNYFKED
jgi:hypothetical protein